MTDLKNLLGLALGDAPATAQAGTMPVDDDLARGQRLLRRRTRRRMMAGSAAAAVVAIGVIVPTVASGPGAPAAKATAGIKLVDYTGTQVPGYTVTVIPDHWVIQGSNPYALTIAPANASNKDPDVFIGKLVILQEQFDTAGTRGLTKTDVHGRTAFYRVQDGIASLVIEQAPGRWLDVQAPMSLGWSEQQEAQFGAGVTILPTAKEGQG
jgi:hypothetical protein